MRVLNDFWATYEIAGVALVDMAVWHWMYDHPEATPKQLNDAAVQISINRPVGLKVMRPDLQADEAARSKG